MLSASTTPEVSFKFPFVLWSIVSGFTMKKHDSECSLSRGTRGQRPARVLTESMSSEEGPDTERLLASQLSAAVMVAASARRQSLTAPPSPTDSRKKHHHRHHNYMNHLQQLIHWRDIWGGEPHKGQEVQRLMICSKCYQSVSNNTFFNIFTVRRYFLCTIFVYLFACSIISCVSVYTVACLLYTHLFIYHFYTFPFFISFNVLICWSYIIYIHPFYYLPNWHIFLIQELVLFNVPSNVDAKPTPTFVIGRACRAVFHPLL